MKRFILSIAVVVVLVVPSLASARVTSLTMSQARHAAANRAWSFHPDGGVKTVKASWCMRWFSPWRIHCSAEADGTVYDSELDWDQPTSCQATVNVTKNSRTGRITTRLEQDMSCMGVW